MTADNAPPVPPAPGAGQAMTDCPARHWRWMMVRGVLAIAIGAVSVTLPMLALQSLILVFAVYMLMDGVIGIIAAVRAARAGERWGWLVSEGVLSILAGGVAALLPGLALMSFVLLVSVWAVLSGGALLVAGIPAWIGWPAVGG